MVSNESERMDVNSSKVIVDEEFIMIDDDDVDSDLGVNANGGD